MSFKMNMEDLIDQLAELLDKGMRLPGGRVIVDVEKMRAVIDDLSLNMPQEVKQARGIVSDRAGIIEKAKMEADATIRSAEERAKAMVAQEEITKLAQQRANEIISNAQAKSRDMRKAAQDFVEDLMRRADEGLTADLAELRRTRAALKPQAPAAPINPE